MKKKSYQGLTQDGFHTIAYREYGTKGNPVIVAVHGLTRNSYDFHVLAEKLQNTYHIFALDMIGRGESDYVNACHYTYQQYISDLMGLLARIDTDHVYWIGTSMGGILGMILASLPQTPIKKLILNDVGAMVSHTVIERLLAYAGVQIKMPNRQQIVDLAKAIYAPFGAIDTPTWDKMLDHSLKKLEDGSYTFAYDPNITSQFSHKEDIKTYQDEEGNLTLWQYWDKITCPVYIINGTDSDLLTPSILSTMKTRGPAFDYHAVAHTGHAPWLVSDDICQVIKKWLDR